MYMANETTILLSEYTQDASIMEKIVYSIIWVLLLLFVAWPLACFCAAWWIFFLPLEAFLPVLRDANNFLEKYVMCKGHSCVFTTISCLSLTHALLFFVPIFYRLILWPREVGEAIKNGSKNFPAPF